MKVVLAALNAKYIHSSLATRYLKAFCEEIADIQTRDYSINEEVGNIVADMYTTNPDIVGFSCYIWNIEQTMKVAETLKKVLPQTRIVLGGPEVSFNPQKYLKHEFVEAVVCGEGEETFKEYLIAITKDKSLNTIAGLAHRQNKSIEINPVRCQVKNLDKIPFPYSSKDLSELKNKIVYYESSRGCAFGCSYCLSSADRGVRYFSPERVAQDLQKFIQAGVKQVKFVDRTFNLSTKHAMRVWKLISDSKVEDINFHFEIAADLLTGEMLTYLKNFNTGVIQFEIGVQSTHYDTLTAINRRSDLYKLRENVKILREYNNIHLHLDLIAGLPEDNMISFEKSFNDVYALRPHNLQLGFLKVLHGTHIHNNLSEYAIIAASYPPYEVLQTPGFSYKDLLLLKQIEETLEIYHNSNHFEFIFKYAFSRWQQGAFEFYRQLSYFISTKTKEKMGFDAKARILKDFMALCWPEEVQLQQEILILDLLSNQKRFSYSEWLSFNDAAIKQFTLDLARNEDFVSELSEVTNDWRKIIKQHLFIPCSKEIAQLIYQKADEGFVIFNYSKIDKITGRYASSYHALIAPE